MLPASSKEAKAPSSSSSSSSSSTQKAETRAERLQALLDRFEHWKMDAKTCILQLDELFSAQAFDDYDAKNEEELPLHDQVRLQAQRLDDALQNLSWFQRTGRIRELRELGDQLYEEKVMLETDGGEEAAKKARKIQKKLLALREERKQLNQKKRIELRVEGERAKLRLLQKKLKQERAGEESDQTPFQMAFPLVLESIGDLERRATLQLRYVLMNPSVKSLCCRRQHCFNCKVRDHSGPCAPLRSNEKINYCPKCNVAVVKGDGCNSITCVCGCCFTWED